jgi:hypothetical protein
MDIQPIRANHPLHNARRRREIAFFGSDEPALSMYKGLKMETKMVLF